MSIYARLSREVSRDPRSADVSPYCNRSGSIVLRSVKMIPLRESISRSHMSSRSNLPDDIKVLKKKGPLSLPLREFTRVLEIGQVFMISEDRDRMRSPLQILFPFSKSEDNSKEFLIIDVVVALS